jgi:deaminated glutathione amidase
MKAAPKAAVIQMNSGDDVAANLAQAEALLAQAAGEGAVLAALPENFAFMGAKERDKLAHAEADGEGRIQHWLAATAKRHGLWIVAGTLPIAAPDGRVYAACSVYDMEGHRAARYDKIHLFDVDVGHGEIYRESNSIAPGVARPVAVDTPLGRLGLSVCYDLRFPELYRALVADGCTLLSVPAAFTAKTGAVHWHTLLKARAVENLCYVLAPGQCGKHPGGRSTWGHSLILDPWGDTLAEVHGEAPAIAVAILDPNHLDAIRQRFPALSHRRL